MMKCWRCLGLLVLNVATVFSLETYDMEQYCGKELSMTGKSLYQGRLELDVQRYFSSGNESLSPSCEVELESWHTYDRIMFYFEDLDLPCDIGSISIYDGDSSSSTSYVDGLPENICGTNKPVGTFTSSGMSIAIKYTPVFTASQNDAFELIFSSFYDASCRSYDYSCDNDRCIADDINCNGHNPCGDGSDCKQTGENVAGIVVGCLIAVGVLISVLVAVVCLYSRRVREPRIPRDDEPDTTQQTVNTFSVRPAKQIAAPGASHAYSTATYSTANQITAPGTSPAYSTATYSTANQITAPGASPAYSTATYSTANQITAPGESPAYSTANQTAASWAPPAYSAAMGTAPPGQQWVPPAHPVQSYPGQQTPGVTVSSHLGLTATLV